MNLQTEAIRAIQTADFRPLWPRDARSALVLASNTDGEFPPYAAKHTRWALKTVRDIEKRMAKDIEIGEASLSQSQRKVLAK